MSTMEPHYGIPSAIRYGIMALQKWDDEYIINKILDEVRDLINEHASKLPTEDIEEILSYADNLQDYLESMLESYEKMGFVLPEETIKEFAHRGIFLTDNAEELIAEEAKESEKEEKSPEITYTPEQKFMRHAMADNKGGVASQIETMSCQLYVLRLAQVELAKHISDDKAEQDGKILNKVPETKEDID